MLTAYDPAAVIEYSLKRDTSDPKTVFFIGALDAQLTAILRDQTVRYSSTTENPDEAESIIRGNGRALELVRFGVRGWKVLADPKTGAEIPFVEKEHISSHPVKGLGPRNGLTNNAINLLVPYIQELAQQVDALSQMTGDQEKNSDTPSRS